jgi:predicted nucleic acid-binding protein
VNAWVIDASVAGKWLLPEERSDKALRLRADRLVAPSFFDVECGAILWKAFRRGEISDSEARSYQLALRLAPVERISEESLLAAALSAAIELRHPIYDCLYIAAAEATGFPVVTADARLARIKRSGVTIVPLDDVR